MPVPSRRDDGQCGWVAQCARLSVASIVLVHIAVQSKLAGMARVGLEPVCGAASPLIEGQTRPAVRHSPATADLVFPLRKYYSADYQTVKFALWPICSSL
jgi:hypothetical protein